MPNPNKWDIWIWSIWILTAASSIYATFLIMRCGIIERIIGIDNVSTLPGYDYLLIVGLIGLTTVLFLLAVLCSVINDDLKSAIGFYRDGMPLTSGSQGGVSSHHLSGDEFADDRKALRVLRMSPGSPLRGILTENAVIYHVNDTPVSTAAEANSALIEGRNSIQWKDAKGDIKVAEIDVQGRDLEAQFEQRYRS